MAEVRAAKKNNTEIILSFFFLKEIFISVITKLKKFNIKIT